MTEDKRELSKKSMQEFFSEAEEIIDSINRELLRLDEGAKEGRLDPDILNSVFRAAHSLKGMCGIFGFHTMITLSHNLEEILDSLRFNKITLSPALLDLLFENLELLLKLIKAQCDGEDVDGERVEQMIQRMEQVVVGQEPVIDSSLAAQLDIDVQFLSVLTEYEEHRLKDNMGKGLLIYRIHLNLPLATFDMDINRLTANLKNFGEVITTIPSATSKDNSKIDFDILFASDKSHEALNHVLGDEPYHMELIQRRGAQPEEIPNNRDGIVIERDEPVLSDEEPLSIKSLTQAVRVDINKLDQLMNVVGELTLQKLGIGQVVESLRAHGGFTGAVVDLHRIHREMERKLNELQNRVLEVRMVPLGQLFDKISRIVRKLTREDGKEVELVIQGADTELDKFIIEDLADPVMHVIRNAIDHGIESTDERELKGKESIGTVHISARQRGNHVVIEVEDDGKGFDEEAILAKAMQRGLVEERVKLSRKEILDLVLLPGFTTKEEADEVSGRGVGMDVVKNNIARIGGMIDLESKNGQGAKVTLTLPITLAIIKALMTRVSNHLYAIPLTAVQETLLVKKEDFKFVGRQEVIIHREQTLPVIRLSEIFSLSASSIPAKDSFLVVAGHAQKKVGIMVDELFGQQDIVIKSIGEVLKNVKGIAGATETEDKTAVLVLDIGGLVEEAIKV